MIIRMVAAPLAALLIAAQVMRTSAVDAWSDAAPQQAALLWSGHPDVELSVAMTQIAQAARDGKPVGDSAFQLIDDAARKAPLSAAPYLVHGVAANIAGNFSMAERAFLAAQRRDPRSIPAAYFLADRYLRGGEAAQGLRQMATLARLTPGGPQKVAPYIAAYAQNRSNWPLLRAMFNSNSRLEEAALAEMAASPRNADAILALARVDRRNSSAIWVRPLLRSLIATGQYERARTIWASTSGVRLDPGALLFDPRFSQEIPPAPFNWELASSNLGLAERRPGGSLHVLYYGQEDGALARQLLLLPPGTYRLSLRVVGGSVHAEALNWSLRCDKASQELVRISLGDAAAHGWTFQVPAGCAAQWIELNGASSDMPQQSDVTITGLTLIRGGGRG
jgi:hypothetical protein